MFAGRDRHAAGHSASNWSASNWHEQPQSHRDIRAATAGAFFPSKSRPASESDIDAEIMRRNVLHEPPNTLCALEAGIVGSAACSIPRA